MKDVGTQSLWQKTKDYSTTKSEKIFHNFIFDIKWVEDGPDWDQDPSSVLMIFLFRSIKPQNAYSNYLKYVIHCLAHFSLIDIYNFIQGEPNPVLSLGAQSSTGLWNTEHT